MNPECQVCSLEKAKKLKELGVVQDSYFYWRDKASTPYVFMDDYKHPFNSDLSRVSAFVTEELYGIWRATDPCFGDISIPNTVTNLANFLADKIISRLEYRREINEAMS